MEEIGGNVTFVALETEVEVDGVSDCLLTCRAGAAPGITLCVICGWVFAMLIVVG